MLIGLFAIEQLVNGITKGFNHPEPPDEDLLALDEALDKLAEIDPPKAQLVKLRYFGGLTMSDTAKALGLSLATTERYWVYARAWLHRHIVAGGHAAPGGPD